MYLAYKRNDGSDPANSLAFAIYNINEDRWSVLDPEKGSTTWTFPPGSGVDTPDDSLLDHVALAAWNPPGAASVPLVPLDDIAFALFTEKDVGGGNPDGMNVVDSTGGELVLFGNPGTSLTVTSASLTAVRWS